MKNTLLILMMLLAAHFSFGQKKDKWMAVQGIVVDTTGQVIANERIALINKRGNDKKIIVSDKEGNFSFRIKRKNIGKLSLKCYSDYVRTDVVKIIDFINNKNFLVLNFDNSRKLFFRRGGCNGHFRVTEVRFRVPFNDGDTNELIRSYFSGVK